MTGGWASLGPTRNQLRAIVLHANPPGPRMISESISSFQALFHPFITFSFHALNFILSRAILIVRMNLINRSLGFKPITEINSLHCLTFDALYVSLQFFPEFHDASRTTSPEDLI